MCGVICSNLICFSEVVGGWLLVLKSLLITFDFVLMYSIKFSFFVLMAVCVFFHAFVFSCLYWYSKEFRNLCISLVWGFVLFFI